jgi:hypothetical protein
VIMMMFRELKRSGADRGKKKRKKLDINGCEG